MAVNQVKPSFPLSACWREPLALISQALHKLVSCRVLSAAELSATAKLIGALDRLPLATENMELEASLTLEHERSWGALVLQLYAKSFSIGYLEGFDSGAGWDHESRSVIDVELSDYSSVDGDDPITVMNDLQDWAVEWMSRAEDASVKFEISDQARDYMWYEDDDLNDRWKCVPDGV